MSRLKVMQSRLRAPPSRLQSPPKVADPFYSSPEWEAARKAALDRAGWRCEIVEGGVRCGKCTRHGDRMYVDHLVELKDGGAPLDLRNLGVKCSSHHVIKTVAERARRMSR